MRFDHVDIPTQEPFDGEFDQPCLKMTVSDHESNPTLIQWRRHWPDAP